MGEGDFPRKITYSREIKFSPLSLMSTFNKGFLKLSRPLLKRRVYFLNGYFPNTPFLNAVE